MEDVSLQYKNIQLTWVHKILHIDHRVTCTGYYDDFHRQLQTKFIYVLSGEGCFHINGREYELSPHSLFFTPKYTVHKTMVKPGVPYDRYIIFWDDDFSDMFLGAGDLQAFHQLCRKMRTADRYKIEMEGYRDHLEPLLDALFHYDGYLGAVYQRNKLMEIILYLFHVLNKEIVATENEQRKNFWLVDEMTAYIMKHLKDVTVSDIAKYFYLDENNLYKIFNRYTGCGPKQYITQKRMAKAYHLLFLGRPLNEVCDTVGFRDCNSLMYTVLKKTGLHYPILDNSFPFVDETRLQSQGDKNV